jgi:hypothetical protein
MDKLIKLFCTVINLLLVSSVVANEGELLRLPLPEPIFQEWVSDCCLTPIEQFFNYIMARTS